MKPTLQCSVRECTKRPKARGMCQTHYSAAWKRGGHAQLPLTPGTRWSPLSVEARFRRIGWDITEPGCWEWRGSLNAHGYGQMGGSDKRAATLQTHRVSYALFKGEPDGYVCHTCDNRRCLNPDHLYLGDASANARDAMVRARTTRGTFKPNSKLSDNAVRQIRQRYAAGGFTQSQLASEYGVSRSLVSLIVLLKHRVHASRPGASPRST